MINLGVKMTISKEAQTIGLQTGPIQSIDNDLMGMSASALALANLLMDVDPPFTVGLRGDWGTGKSSLVKMTQSLFYKPESSKTVSKFWGGSSKKPSTPASDTKQEAVAVKDEIYEFRKNHSGKVDIVEFNPWADSELVRGSRISSVLIERFIRALRDKGYIDKPLAKSLLLRIGRPVARMTTGSFFSIFGKSGNAAAHEMEMSGMSASLDEAIYSDSLRKELSTRLKATKFNDRRMVFFIDDLDRVAPEQAVAILDIITSLLDMPRCVFLVALDQDVLMPGVVDKLRSEEAAKNYFDKVFNISIRVSNALTSRNLQGLVSKPIKVGKNEIHIPKLAQPIITQCAFDNPRTLKRLMWLAHFRQVENQTSKVGRDGAGRELQNQAFDELAAALAAVEDAYPVFHRIVFSSEASTSDHWRQMFSALDYGSQEQDDEAEKHSKNDDIEKKYDAILRALVKPTSGYKRLDEEECRAKYLEAKAVIIAQFKAILEKVTEPEIDEAMVIEQTLGSDAQPQKDGWVYPNRRSSGWMATYLASSLMEYRKNFGRSYSYPQSIYRYMAQSWSFASVFVGDYAGFLKDHVEGFTIYLGANGMEIWVKLRDGSRIESLIDIEPFSVSAGSFELTDLSVGITEPGLIGTPASSGKFRVAHAPKEGKHCIFRYEFEVTLVDNDQFEDRYDALLEIAAKVIELSVECLGADDES